MTLRATTLLLIAASPLAGCAGLSWTAPAHTGAERTAAAPDAEAAAVQTALYSQHHDWAGTRYRHGGLSRSGIDCSGLVQLTFRNRFGIELPRTTAAQAREGQRIDLNRLQPGDLVFFRTGRTRLHVGIYVEDGRFLHASTSGGVMLSGLSEAYWRGRFWQARRVPGLPVPGTAGRG